tara:strand:+ start:949 stop:3075 length:2127 start_codon:yes stop_codon:yes gene_type:complete
MKIKLLLFGLFLSLALNAQSYSKSSRMLEWADYYFINEDYDKALWIYLKLGDSLPLKSRRNLSKVYAKEERLKKAAQTLRPLVDSDSAEVKDYYYFASYLTGNDKLRDEYRRKAIKLPIETPSLEEIDSLKSSYDLIPLSINSEESEFGAHLILKNKILVYSQKQSKDYTKRLNRKIRSKYPIYNIYQAQWDSKNLKASQPKAFPIGLNSVFQDGPSSWDSETEILYFTRSAQTIKKQKNVQLNLYAWDLKANKVEAALPVSVNVDGYSTLHPAVNAEKRRLYFSSDRPGGFGGMDLYYSEIMGDGNYGPIVNLGPDINTIKDEIFPFMYKGNYLFYSSKSDNGNISPKLAVNTVDVRWHVMSLPSPFDSEQDDFSISVNNNLQYGFISSNRERGMGDDDLYTFRFTPTLIGLMDDYTYNPIDTLIISQNGILKNDNILMMKHDPLTVLFPKQVELIDSVRHGWLKLNANGSFLYKNMDPIQVKDSFAYVVKSLYGKSKAIKVLLKRSEVDKEKLPEKIKETFLPIFYEFDKFDLLVDFKDRVEAVVAAMQEEPSMIVEISSYTDCRGSFEYNLRLSNDRNQTIIDYVRERIENPDRIFGKGYGENNVVGNTTTDYLIISGSYASIGNALNQQKDLESLGFKIQINETRKKNFRVIVGQTNTYADALKIIDDLNEKGKEGWINLCDCCELTEEEHLQNRRTDFKIIKF